jgi:LPXTG-motif cell wall-anchored protein
MPSTLLNYTSNESGASTTLRDFKKSGAKQYFNVDNEGWEWKNGKCNKSHPRCRRQQLKKLMLLAAALAMALITAVPAVAQVGQENDQEGESGEVDQSFTVTGSGDSANQCAALLGGAQSGNSQNQIGIVESDESEADDFEFDETGSNVTLSPELAEECEQIINQAAASATAPKAAPAPVPKTEAKAEAKKAEVKTEEKEAEAKKAEAKKAEEKKAGEKKELPKTGGSGTASLLALGAGALLVVGGLLVRRIFR